MTTEQRLSEIEARADAGKDPQWESVPEGDGFERGVFDRTCKEHGWSPLFNIAQGLRMASMLGAPGASYTDMMAVYANECAEHATTLRASEARVAKLEEALNMYGKHHDGCRVKSPGHVAPFGRSCDCGYAETRAALEDTK